MRNFTLQAQKFGHPQSLEYKKLNFFRGLGMRLAGSTDAMLSSHTAVLVPNFSSISACSIAILFLDTNGI